MARINVCEPFKLNGGSVAPVRLFDRNLEVVGRL